MRLKTFSAQTMSDAMALVRADMGPDAIIVATDGRDGADYRITAAIEDASPIPEAVAEEASAPDPVARDAYLRHVLIAHGLPVNLVRIVMNALAQFPDAEAHVALAAAIDMLGGFLPLDIRAPLKPILLAGAPGAGKTIVAAKLAAQAKLAGRKPYVATTDTKRAGGIQQLEAYTRILGIDLVTLDTPEKLAAEARTIKAADIAIIDTAGVNAFDADDMASLDARTKLIDAEPMLVLAAGGDALDCADIAATFRDIGTKRMIVTRIDMTRRLGSILSAMIGGRIAIAAAGINPGAADGLQRLNPVTLAGLILPDDREKRTTENARKLQ